MLGLEGLLTLESVGLLTQVLVELVTKELVDHDTMGQAAPYTEESEVLLMMGLVAQHIRELVALPTMVLVGLVTLGLAAPAIQALAEQGHNVQPFVLVNFFRNVKYFYKLLQLPTSSVIESFSLLLLRSIEI